MKAVYILATLMSISSCLPGQIKNGYENQIHRTIESIQKLNFRLSTDDLSFLQRQLIRSEIKELTDIILHYQLTQQLINQFRIISPLIYHEMDSIRDKRGRPVAIFIKLIPREGATIQLKAATVFMQSPFDGDASLSEYGENSVSINLWIGDNALQLLSHEFGHIKYVAPNLADYVKFYKKWYKTEISDFTYFGHNRFDESGKAAIDFEQRFRRDLASYLVNGGRKFESPALLLVRIRKNSRRQDAPFLPEMSFAWAFASR